MNHLQEIADTLSLPDSDFERFKNNTDFGNKLNDWIVAWLTEFDRCQIPHDKLVNKSLDDSLDKWNDMHIFGQALCSLFEKADLPIKTLPNIDDLFGKYASRFDFSETKSLEDTTWRNLSDIIHALQNDFADMFEYDVNDGYCVCIDLDYVFACLLKRIGFFLNHSWQQKEDDPDIISGHLKLTADGWVHVSDSCIVEILNSIHVMMGLSRMLNEATPIPLQQLDTLQFFNHHREASLDDFYFLSMISDLSPGFVLQYQHQFRHLFHSITQVIFYHYPSYHRRKQLPLNQIKCKDSKPENVLPLAQQLYPHIPILHEHTNMGHAATHANYEYAWILCGKTCLLVSKDMKVYAAENILNLVCYLNFILSENKKNEI